MARIIRSVYDVYEVGKVVRIISWAPVLEPVWMITWPGTAKFRRVERLGEDYGRFAHVDDAFMALRTAYPHRALTLVQRK